MTVPIPPADGQTPPGDRFDSSAQGGTVPGSAASLPGLSGEVAAAEAAGDAWCAEAGPLMGSPQGYADGRDVAAPQQAPEWPTTVSFPHDGP